MNILVLNQNWFVTDLRKAGHTVVTCGISKHLEIYLESPLINIDTVIKGLPQEQRPDVILILDNSSPVMLSGIEDLNIPVVFYSVDTHHHSDLHAYMAGVVDYTLVAQKDYLPVFEGQGEKAEWMPLWASQYAEPGAERRHGAVFVGTLNPKLNPARVKFFDELKQRAEILCMSGSFPEIFPYSEIVINQTVKGDLNFRVFEAMMCGPMLLTEGCGNGLFDLFQDGTHLVTYRKGDVEEAAHLIKKYLSDIPICRKIAAAGRAEILARHQETHRAARIREILENVKKASKPRKHYCAMTNYVAFGRGIGRTHPPLAARAYLSALKCAEQGLNANEALSDELSCYLVLACLRYDQHIPSGAGAELLRRVRAANPNSAMVGLACMRHLLNTGKVTEAENLAREMSACDVRDTFQMAEQTVLNLLSENA